MAADDHQGGVAGELDRRIQQHARMWPSMWFTAISGIAGRQSSDDLA